MDSSHRTGLLCYQIFVRFVSCDLVSCGSLQYRNILRIGSPYIASSSDFGNDRHPINLASYCIVPCLITTPEFYIRSIMSALERFVRRNYSTRTRRERYQEKPRPAPIQTHEEGHSKTSLFWRPREIIINQVILALRFQALHESQGSN